MNKQATPYTFLVCLSVCLSVFWGCDGQGGASLVDSTAGVDDTSATADVGAARTVGDVTVGRGDRGSASMGTGLLAAKVMNESQRRVSTTLEFIREGEVVHLAVLDVRAETATLVRSARRADALVIAGQDDRGEDLTGATFAYGVDFDEGSPAIYRIAAESAPIPSQGGDAREPDLAPQQPDAPAIESAPDQPTAETPRPVEPAYAPPTITLIAPTTGRRVALGSMVRVAWSDSTTVAKTQVTIGLRVPTVGADAPLTLLSQPIDAGLDGANDAASVLVQGVSPHEYELVVVIDDGLTKAESSVVIDVYRPVPANESPSLSILSPGSPVALHADELLLVRWSDQDGDSAAMIQFRLESSETPDAGARLVFPLGSRIAEDADGEGDVAHLPLTGVLPGLYDLVARIEDASSASETRVREVVDVLPPAENAAPLLLLDAIGVIKIQDEGVLNASWTDEDVDDNAVISLLLDPDQTGANLDGDEILLLGSISEDADGSQGAASMPIIVDAPLDPNDFGIPEGTYRLAGRITDGVAEIVTFAAGKVILTLSEEKSASEGGNPIGSGGEGLGGVTPGGEGSDDNPEEGDPGDDVTPGEAPSTAITLVEPAVDMSVRLGDRLPVVVQGLDDASDVDLNFFLTNEPFGGQVRVPLTLGPAFSNNGDHPAFRASVRIPLGAAITSDTWPRTFAVELKTSVGNATVETRAPGLICLKQSIQVIDVAVSEAVCSRNPTTTTSTLANESFGEAPPTAEPEAFRVTWDDGQCDLADLAVTPVQFWLSRDGTVPLNGPTSQNSKLVLEVTPSVAGPSEVVILKRALLGLPDGFYDLLLVTPSGSALGVPAVDLITPDVRVCNQDK